MKYAVIDVGSNSVRMLFNEDGASIFKEIKITQLAKGMVDGILDNEAVDRTVDAVGYFVSKARSLSVDKIYCFATAAIRNAKNRQVFIEKVKNLYQLDVEVISGEKEAYLGALGALSGGNGGVIDIGGASSEIAILKNGRITYSYSLSVGAVSLTDIFSQDCLKAKQYLSEKLKEFGKTEPSNFTAIGGTATSISAILQELEPYDSTKIHGFIIKKNDLSNQVDKLFKMKIEDRKNIKGLQPQRAEVIAQGSLILLSIMNYLKIDSVTISESDNLEGYLMEKNNV